LKQILQEEVMDRFDHRNLNLDCPEFAALNPTGENISVVIYNLLRNRLSTSYDLQVRLWETERNYFEYPA
ncbi:MAG: 6-carboxytetrahydropterin synthase, partial [Chitinophagales bacterium]|nr:6-carboxytetrahydropterin synthase [Chitinophagales bacterium]